MEESPPKKQTKLSYFFPAKSNDTSNPGSSMQPEESDHHHLSASAYEIQEENTNSAIIEENSIQICENDIGHAVSPTFNRRNEQAKYRLLKDTWTPSSDHVLACFKAKDRKRPFQLAWISGQDSFEWLAYSQIHKGGFCKFCVLFGSQTSKQKVLVKVPFADKWLQRGKPALSAHAASIDHRDAVQAVQNFERTYKGQKDGIDGLLCTQKRDQDKKRRELMEFIISAVKFLGHQGLALRGKIETQESNSRGNFLELLQFLGQYNSQLKEHLTNPNAANATHLSPQSQNEIISIIGRKIQESILKEVKASKFYSVLADETTDVSGNEQMSLVIRYVKNNTIQESFLDFVDMESTTGEALAEAIEAKLGSWGLDLNMLRGQGYDGASNMSGHRRGCQALIQQKYPLAIYTHCYSHCLNLVIVQTCDERSIRNMLGYVQTITAFIRESAKRLHIFDENLGPEANRRRLKNLCQTRWVERADALTMFKENLEPIIATLTAISEERSQKSCTADAYLKSICHFDFLITLICVEKLLAFSLPVVRHLQLENLDFLAAIDSVNDALNSVKSWRENADTRFHNIFNHAVKLAETLNVEVKMPRQVGRQTHRANPSSATPEEYFRVTVFIPMCDHFIQEMTKRFNKGTKTAFLASLFIPTEIRKFSDIEVEEKTKPLVDMYRNDLPTPDLIDSEITTWRLCWQKVKEADCPKTVLAALEHCKRERFPNIHCLFTIFAVLPVTTCECERTFSNLKRLKTFLRSTMKQERLVGLALMSIHREKTKDLPVNTIVDEYCSKDRRGIAKI